MKAHEVEELQDRISGGSRVTTDEKADSGLILKQI
jgi:hypothetical protein